MVLMIWCHQMIHPCWTESYVNSENDGYKEDDDENEEDSDA